MALLKEWPRHAVLPFAAATLWLGMLVGVSFLATPIKFAAPSLSLPVALDVGRVTFGLFSKVEWVMAMVLVVAVFATPAGRVMRIAALAAAAIVVIQAAWLLPILDARIEAVIAGAPQPPSSDHTVYVVLEALKALALLVVGGMTAIALLSSHPSQDAAGGSHDRATHTQ